MTQNEKENEPWPGHDEAIAELQAWADSIPLVVGDFPPIRGLSDDVIIYDDHQMPDGTLFLGSEAEAASLKAIYEGLGIK